MPNNTANNTANNTPEQWSSELSLVHCYRTKKSYQIEEINTFDHAQGLRAKIVTGPLDLKGLPLTLKTPLLFRYRDKIYAKI